MEEVFQDDLLQYSMNKARWRYHLGVLKLLRPSLLKRIAGSQKLNYYGMFKHNIILSLRIFKRYKSSFLINLTGLATGLASVLLIYLWVADELAIDRFHEKGDRLYQVMSNNITPDGISTWNGTSALLAQAMAEEVPEVEAAVPATDSDWNIQFDLSHNDQRIKATGKHVGPGYFQLFSYPLYLGDASQVLSSPGKAVISEPLAVNLFGDVQKAMGKSLTWQSMEMEGNVLVSGVLKAPPTQATEQFDILLPFEAYTQNFGEGWQNPNSVTYVLLKEGADLAAVNVKIRDIMQSKVPESTTELFLANFSDQYLYGRYENGVQAGGRIDYVIMFSIIAVVILLIACINFMNLSTARASRRLKEVGVKKAVGASRLAMVFQYLSESILLAFISLVTALFLVYLIMPQFNLITGKQLALTFNSSITLASIIFVLITGLLAGSYPGLYLSKFHPTQVLKGRVRSSAGELWVRKGLVIFQFTLTIIFIIGVLVVYKQVELIQTKNLGFQKENVIYFEREGQTVENLEGFLEGLKQLPGVKNASAFNNSLFSPPGVNDFSWEGMADEPHNFKRQIAYYDYIETLGVELKEGRTFNRDFPLKDEWQIVINEKAAEIMGFDEPVGKRARLWGLNAEIVGVVKDFHFQSLHQAIGPVFFQLDPRFLVNTMVSIEPGMTRETLERIEDFYAEFNPGFVFNYQFLDQDFQAQYDAENKVAALSKYFAGLAILISCLGLLGLVAFAAERRTKEIGIRKVLGCGNLQIVYMLSRDFTGLIVFAVAMALPVSYYLSKSWLTGFAYPIDLQWWFFAGAGLGGLLLAWLTLSFQTVKMARTSPVVFLRDE